MTKIKRLIMDDGERLSVLVDCSGMPLFDPNLFVTRTVRNAGLSISSIEAHLRAIQSLMAWERDFNIDVTRRFSSGGLLEELEIESLLYFLSLTQETIRKVQRGVKLLPGAYKYKDSEVTYATIGYAAEYLGYLIKGYSPDPGRAVHAEDMVSIIKRRRVKQKTHLNDFEDKALTEEEEATVLDALDPDSPSNPWSRSEAVRWRNAVMFLVLKETGIRRGELANIRIPDIDFRSRYLHVKRRHHSKSDPRVAQPNVKTRERKIALSEALCGAIEDYVNTHRRCNKVARQHDILFVSHQGKTLGRPIALVTINYVFRCLQKAAPALSGLHPHRLRHHANYDFSRALDEAYAGKSAEERQKADEQLRSKKFGWSPTGTEQTRYNQRYIQEKVDEATDLRNAKFTSVEQKELLHKLSKQQSGGEA